MEKKHKNKINIYVFDKLKLSGISHFVSTREGGVSVEPYFSLNLASHVGDDQKNILKNRKIVAREMGFNLSSFALLNQVHSGRVVSIGGSTYESEMEKCKDSFPKADAMITNTPEVCLLVQTADCVPLLLYDPVAGVVAAVHAGWRGTMKQITKNTVFKMQKDFGCKTENIIAGVGPAIGPCCYEIINEDLLKKWKELYPQNEEIFRKDKKKVFLDLWKINEIQLVQSGVRKENIEISRICTQCCDKDFYSHRREGVTGRFGSGIMLRK